MLSGKTYLFVLLLLAGTNGALAQFLVGKITDQDSAQTPLFMAEVSQIRDGITEAIYKTYFDGTYRIKVKPGETYQLKVSFPGRSDTTVTISVDKHSTLYSGSLFISMHKDGLRLTGFILDRVQDIPVKDACLILKNVMTRKEEKITTDISGAYNLKMDYETNYTLRIDKMSPGIINKYQDTSLSISTIGFNKPLDFRLDIKLGPTNGYIAPRPEYDAKAKPVNRNLKPAFVVLGVKDSVKRKAQDSIIALMYHKDSLIASLNKRIGEINPSEATEHKVLLKDEQGKVDKAALKQQQLEKAEAELKAKKQAENELEARLNQEIKEVEARRIAQAKADKERQVKELQEMAEARQKAEAAKAQAEQDSLLRIAEARNREIMAKRKQMADSVAQVRAQEEEASKEQEVREQLSKMYAARIQKEQDSLLKAAEAKNRELMAKRRKIADSLNLVQARKADADAEAGKVEAAKAEAQRAKAEQDSIVRLAESANRDLMLRRKHVLDSLINIESQKSQVSGMKAGKNVLDTTEVASRRNQQISKIQSEQDSLIKVAEAKNREIMVFRKHVLDSLIKIDNQRKAQAKAEEEAAARLSREKKELELTAKLEQEKHAHEAEEARKRAELEERERLKKEELEMSIRLAEQRKKAELEAQEKYNREALERKQQEQEARKKAELAAQAELLRQQRERIAAEQARMKKLREQEAREAIAKTEMESVQKMSQLEIELAAMKKARELAEIKLEDERRQKELTDKMALNEAKRVTADVAEQAKIQKQSRDENLEKAQEIKRQAARKEEAEREQRQLEARKALEEEEKNELMQQLGSLESNEQTRVTRNDITKQEEFAPEKTLEIEKEKEVNNYGLQQRQERKRVADSIAHISNFSSARNAGNKLVHAKGFVRNGQTDDPVAGVSVNIRRVNSIVSQEVSTDASGKYDIVLDSGYYYLISYYKDKFEISKQILDLTSYQGTDYLIVMQYLKERNDFDPAAKMPVIQFNKNSSKLPKDADGDLGPVIKLLKEDAAVKIQLYGLASVDEDYPMELSVTRARLTADKILESGIKPAQIRINGIGAYRPRSGCTEGKTCSENQYKLDRVVMYKVAKD